MIYTRYIASIETFTADLRVVENIQFRSLDFFGSAPPGMAMDMNVSRMLGFEIEERLWRTAYSTVLKIDN